MGKGGATESPKSFDRFERFRDLSASERTLSRLAQLLGTTEKSLQKVSSKHDWPDRASAWELKGCEIGCGGLTGEAEGGDCKGIATR